MRLKEKRAQRLEIGRHVRVTFARRPCTEVLVRQRLIRTRLGFEEYGAGLERNKGVKRAARNVRAAQITPGPKNGGLRYGAAFIEAHEAERATQHDESFIAQGIRMPMRADVRVRLYCIEQTLRRMFRCAVEIEILSTAGDRPCTRRKRIETVAPKDLRGRPAVAHADCAGSEPEAT